MSSRILRSGLNPSLTGGRRFSANLVRTARKALFYAIVASLLVIWLFPIAWTALTSLKTERDAFAMPPKWLFDPTFDNYRTIFTKQPFHLYIVNSVVVTGGSTLLAVAVGTPAAFALSRFQFRGKRDLAFYVLSSRFAPPLLVLLPFFLLFNRLGMTNTLWSLMIVYAATTVSFVVWLMKSFFDEVPKELDEAAMIDGASRFSAFLRVIIPLARGGLAATAIFSAIFAWNEFLFALVLTGNSSKTLPVAVTSFIQFTGTRWGELTAAATIIMAPMILFAFVIQRGLVRGLTLGAVKS